MEGFDETHRFPGLVNPSDDRSASTNGQKEDRGAGPQQPDKASESWDDLTDGSIENPINLTEEFLEPSTPFVWSNTAPDGTLASPQTCENWANETVEIKSRAGGTTQVDGRWTNEELFLACASKFHIYCFEQG